MAALDGRPAAPPKGKTAQQSQLEQLPLIKKPLELIGNSINVPGAFWKGRMSAVEKEALYVCVVRDHSALHKFMDGWMARPVRPSSCRKWARPAQAAWSAAKPPARSSGWWYPFPVRASLEGLVVVLQGVRGRDHEAAQCER